MADGPVRDFLGTASGEWAVQNGDFAVAAGSVAVNQGIRTRVGLFLSECYLDETKGVDYLGQILIKDPDPLVVRALIQAPIAETPDVLNVIGAEVIQGAGREASVNYAVDTVYSTQPLSAQMEIP